MKTRPPRTLGLAMGGGESSSPTAMVAVRGEIGGWERRAGISNTTLEEANETRLVVGLGAEGSGPPARSAWVAAAGCTPCSMAPSLARCAWASEPGSMASALGLSLSLSS